jgi:transposase
MNEKQPPTPEGAKAEKKPRRKFDAAFKAAAVEHCRRQGGDVMQTAQDLGINYWTLRDWVELAKSPPSSPSPTVLELEQENRRLKAELARVTEQRDILKKSLGILSTP